MSTYNGGRFLEEQLDSILSQEGVDVSLLVRDDGSRDNTCQILSDYSSKHQNIEVKTCENVGFVKSFSALVNMAVTLDIDVDYYAFADQDDIWLPNKLATACDVLATKDNSKPNLFTSNSMQVDAEGRELELFHKGPEPKFRKGNVLVFGTEQGCSMVFNRKAVDIYSEHEPNLTWHDRWMYHICYFLGSVTYDHQPLFYYRRHEKNALANHKAGSLEGEPSKIVRVYRILFVEPPVTNHVEMAQEFYDHFALRLKKEDQKLFRRFIICRKSLVSKIYMLFSRHFIYPYYDANEGRLLKWLILAGRL
jgi:rhamnosyltransferase